MANQSAIEHFDEHFRQPSVISSNQSLLQSSESKTPRNFSRVYSPRPSLFDSGSTLNDASSETKMELSDLRLNLVCSWLFQKQSEKFWYNSEDGEGVMVRKAKDEYVCCPTELEDITCDFYNAVKQMNVKCAMTVNTRTTRLMLEMNKTGYVPLDDRLRLQIVPNFKHLPKCQKNQFAAFIQEPPILIVWHEDPAQIVDRVQRIEDQMMSLVLKHQPWTGNEAISSDGELKSAMDVADTEDVESINVSTRRIMLIQPFVIAATLIIMCVTLGAGWRTLAIEAWMGLFFFQTLPTCLAQIIGPVSQMKENSRFFSGKPTRRISGSTLPHITIQCPVYKESLSVVIGPTIRSIKAAISTYEMQGGTANIFVNDDGMQLISPQQAQERRDFYEEHHVGWVARPKHNARRCDHEKAFLRAGKFKKASNMNHALNVSIRVEDKLKAMKRSHSWMAEDEQDAYNEALASIIAEDEGRTWAAGNVRIGDYILLVDSDTRVPPDCFFDAISELEQSPEIAIVQYSSGVMNVTESWFERGITFFTHLVYTAIEFAVANGDVAPFVGHNAFLRWSAVQDVARVADDQPAYHMFWSEDTVSEDFDMALRLQTSGYSLRFASYANHGFKEGVSLTVYDELARWEKYAYGCSELIFHPLSKWLFRGPFTPLFRRFVLSNMPFHSKISIIAYVGTYFAIGSSWLITLLNYFMIGWYNGYLSHYYVDSFQIYFSIIVVFNFIGNISLAILRYRINEQNLLPALMENFKWVLLLTTFLTGISLHISQAILCHLFSIDMSWGATSKEATSTSFFREVPVILRKFRFTFTFCFVLTATMIVMSGVSPFQDVVPYEWQITKFTAIFPLGLLVASHALLPLALNPGLMQFTF